jgi:hypothetical protein
VPSMITHLEEVSFQQANMLIENPLILLPGLPSDVNDGLLKHAGKRKKRNLLSGVRRLQNSLQEIKQKLRKTERKRKLWKESRRKKNLV